MNKEDIIFLCKELNSHLNFHVRKKALILQNKVKDLDLSKIPLEMNQLIESDFLELKQYSKLNEEINH